MRLFHAIKYAVTLFAICLAVPIPGQARPVSYPGGITAMTMNNGDKHSLHLHYSPTARYSIGPRIEYNRGGDYTLGVVQLNNLIKRWNNPDSQANFYVKSGVGAAHSNEGDFDHETEAAGFAGIALDWEDRRYFTSYENRFTEAGDIDSRFMQKARVGITPYIGDYGDLHTWVMVEVEHEPKDDDTWTITPLVRFFKGVHLMETGISDQGDVMFNYVIRY